MSKRDQSNGNTESGEADDITEIYTRLNADSERDRWCAVQRVRRAIADNPDQSETAVERTEPLLSDDSDRIRASTILSLKRIAEQRPDAVYPVAETIRERYDDSARVRIRVAHALRSVCVDNPTEVAQNISCLETAISDKNPVVRRHAKESLKQLVTAEADEETVEEATPDEESAEQDAAENEAHIDEIYSRLNADAKQDRLEALKTVRRAIIDNRDQSETAVERIEPLLSDSSDLVRARAIACLENIAEQKPDAVSPVAETIRERYGDSVRVRKRVAHALRYVCVDDPTEVAHNIDYLQKAVADEDPVVRDNAKESLAQIATTDVAQTIDTPLTETEESISAKIDRTDLEIRALCVSVSDEDEGQRLRERSATALAARASETPTRVRKEIDTEVCSTALTSDIPALRVHMSATLRHLAEDSVDYFLNLAVDSENKKRKGPSPLIIDAAEDRLTDSDERVRKHVLELFSAIATSSFSEIVVARFDQIQTRFEDDSIAVRNAAVATVHRLAKATSALESGSLVEQPPVKYHLGQAVTQALGAQAESIVGLFAADDTTRMDAIETLAKQNHSIDRVWVLWAILRQEYDEFSGTASRIDEQIPRFAVTYGDTGGLSQMLRERAVKEAARIAQDSPTPIETAEQILHALLDERSGGRGHHMVATHALRALKRVGLAPYKKDGELVRYVDMPDIRSMLTDEYGDVRADALEVLMTKSSVDTPTPYGQDLTPNDHETVGELLPHIQACLTDSHDRCQKAAAQTLATFDHSIFRSVDEPGIVLKPFDRVTETRYELEADPLLTALESDLPDVKSQVAWILKTWTNPADLAEIGVSAESLRELLDSDDRGVQQWGLRLLAEIAIVTPDEVLPLVDAVESQLRETRPIESVPPRTEPVEWYSNKTEEKAAVVLALVARSHPEAVDLERIYACGIETPRIPQFIADELTRSELDIGPIQTFVTRLWSLLTDGSSHTLPNIIKTIEAIAQSRPEAARPIAEELQTMLFGTPDTVAADNSSMAKVLAHVAVMHPEELPLTELVQHDNADIRDSAIEAVKRAARSHPTELPLTALAQHSDAGIRDSAIEAVGKTVESQSGQETVEPIRELARGNPEAACQFVGELEQALGESSQRTRRLAVEALATIAKEDPESVRPMRDELLRLAEDATVIQQHAEVTLARVATADHMEPWWTLPLIGHRDSLVNHTEKLVAQSECTVDCATRYFEGIVEISVDAPAESLLLRVNAGETLTDRASYELYEVRTDQESEHTDRELHAEYTEFDQAVEHWEDLLESRLQLVDR